MTLKNTVPASALRGCLEMQLPVQASVDALRANEMDVQRAVDYVFNAQANAGCSPHSVSASPGLGGGETGSGSVEVIFLFFSLLSSLAALTGVLHMHLDFFSVMSCVHIYFDFVLRVHAKGRHWLRSV